MSNAVRRWVLVFALIGLAAASVSLYIHYQILTNANYTSPCDINATFSCSDAYRSRFGSLFGIPVALYGVLWFAFVLVLTGVMSRAPAEQKENYAAYLFALSTIGLAVILYLAYAAFFILRELCVFCLVTYAAVIGLFASTGIATSIPMTSLPRRFVRDLGALFKAPLALVVMLVFFAAAASSLAFFPRAGQPVGPQKAEEVAKDNRSDFEQFWSTQKRETVPVSNEGAAVLIVKFTDYQCPQCGRTYFELQPVLAKYQAEMPGAVRLVSKDYPLNPACNPNVPRVVHGSSCEAAVAVRLAREKHRDAEMEEWLYSNQETMTPESVKQAAETIGHVTAADWEKGAAKALEGVKADAAVGNMLGIMATPTFFVNGVRTNGMVSPAYWDLAIRLELKRAGKLK